MDVALELMHHRAVWIGAHVSILVLVDVALERRICRITRSLGTWFQSLFSWMSLLNEAIAAGGVSPPQVSILVLVDVALEP